MPNFTIKFNNYKISMRGWKINLILSLEEFQQSMTMFITLKLVVKDHNDYIYFMNKLLWTSCNGHIVVPDMTWMPRQLNPNLTIVRIPCHVPPMWQPSLTRQSCHYAMWQGIHWRGIHVIELYNLMWIIYQRHVTQ